MKKVSAGQLALPIAPTRPPRVVEREKLAEREIAQLQEELRVIEREHLSLSRACEDAERLDDAGACETARTTRVRVSIMRDALNEREREVRTRLKALHDELTTLAESEVLEKAS